MTPEDLIAIGVELLSRKGHDYAGDEDRFSNFHQSASVTAWFSDEVDKVFVALITTKLSRLGVLLSKKEPKNESIQDTFVDLINYCALWAGERTSRLSSEEVALALLAKVHTGDFYFMPNIRPMDPNVSQVRIHPAVDKVADKESI